MSNIYPWNSKKMVSKSSLLVSILFGLVVNITCAPSSNSQSSSNASSRKDCCNGANTLYPIHVKSVPYDRQQKALTSFLQDIDNSGIFTPEWRKPNSNSQPNNLQSEMMLKCPHSSCDKKFKHSSDLNYHLRSHTGDRPYTCKFCGATFSYSSNLNRHIKEVHEGKKDGALRCEVCGAAYKRHNGLNQHYKNVHNRQ